MSDGKFQPHRTQSAQRRRDRGEKKREAGISLRALRLCALCVGSVFVPITQPALAADAELNEIVVTAAHDALTDRREAVTQKTVLDRKEIESLGGLTVGEVIRKLPGIDAGENTGDGAPTARVRGMGRDAVQFLVDGERPTANARYALTMVGRMPSGELERIEILRGSSAEHGGSAAVTVNLIMRKAKPVDSTTLKAAIGARGVGGDAEANGQFSVSRGGGQLMADGTQFSWLLPVTVNHHGMPLDTGKTRINANGGTRNLWQEDHERGPYELNELILSPRLTWKKAGDSFTLWPSLYRNEGTRETTLARSAYANPAAGTGLAPLGSRRDREDSDLTITRLRAEGDLKLDGGSRRQRYHAHLARYDRRCHAEPREAGARRAGVFCRDPVRPPLGRGIEFLRAGGGDASAR